LVSSDKQFLVNVLKRPDELEVGDESRLRELSAAYPWFQTPRLLLARTVKRKNQPEFSEYLPYASVYAQDRSLFFSLVNRGEEVDEFLPDSAIKTVPVTETREHFPEFEKVVIETSDKAYEGSFPEHKDESTLSPHHLSESGPQIEFPSDAGDAGIIETRTGEEQGPEAIPETASELSQEETISQIQDEVEEAGENPPEEEMPTMAEPINSSEELLENEEADPGKDESLEEVEDIENFIETGTFAVDLSKVEKPDDETVLPPVEIKEIPFRRLASVYTDTRVDFFHWLDQLTVGKHMPDSRNEVTESKGIFAQPQNNELREDSFPPQVKEQIALIDRFIEKQPSVTRSRVEFYNPVNMAKESEKEADELVTETLAKIYLKQGLVQKALGTYEKLILKFPHKKAYFAALIDEIKATNNP